MRGSLLLLKSLLFLILSHVTLLLVTSQYPELITHLEASLPFNTTVLTTAMSVVASARPAFLTRSFLLGTPGHLLKPHPSSIHRSHSTISTSTRSMSSSARASAAASSAIPHISLHIAASSSGKTHKFQPEVSTYDYNPSNTSALGLQLGTTIDEKRQGRPESGQDAYFVSRVGKDSNTTAFAIADGVGGWTNHGIDPADFSHGLCSHMANISLNWDTEREGKALSPLSLLKQGYKRTISDPEIAAGGTTACVAVTSPSGKMQIANLGDSGFLLLRLGTVHHYSNPQTHAFNTPFQMSLTPPDILKQAKSFGGMPLNDAPERADLAEHMIRHGDVLVLATDGVWDNLDAQDVLKIVSKIMRESGAWTIIPTRGYEVSAALPGLAEQRNVKGKAAKQREPQHSLQSLLAAAIVSTAKQAGLNKHRDGPFAKAVMKEYPQEAYHGGKPDDIAVLVVLGVEEVRGRMEKAKL